MSNEKTSKFTRLGYTEVAANDLIPLVDINGITSRTGETKAITVSSSVAFLSSGSSLEWTAPQFASQTANGLAFDQTVTPNSNPNLYCYGEFPPVIGAYSLLVRAYVPTASLVTSSVARGFIGIGQDFNDMIGGVNNAYIAIKDYDLVAWADTAVSPITLPGFFTNPGSEVFHALLTVDATGSVTLYVNGIAAGSTSGATTTLAPEFIGLGNCTPNEVNIGCTIYEAAVLNDAPTRLEAKQLFYVGPKYHDPSIMAFYAGANLNPGPTQWLDCCEGHHLLLPVSGASATNPSSDFHLRFKNNGVSGYLGDGTKRTVLPENYVLTDCLVYSSGEPLLSIGSTASVAPVGGSGMYSWNNNRVPLTNAIYNRSNLSLSDFGVSHTDKSLYVFYSSSAAPCTFSLEGYIASYGPVLYTPPAPVITSSLTQSLANTVPYFYRIGATNTPMYYSASNLPIGLFFTQSSGIISGTPNDSAGTFYVPLFANNLYGTGSAMLTMSLAVPPTPTPTPAPTSTPTATPAPTSTPTPTPTSTPSGPTATPTPTPAPTASPTPTPAPTTPPTLYTLSVNGDQPGIIGTGGAGDYPAGTTVNINTTLDTGYTFNYWSTTPSISVTGQYNIGQTWYGQIVMPAYAQSITLIGNAPTPTPTPAPTATPAPTPVPCHLWTSDADAQNVVMTGAACGGGNVNGVYNTGDTLCLGDGFTPPGLWTDSGPGSCV